MLGETRRTSAYSGIVTQIKSEGSSVSGGAIFLQTSILKHLQKYPAPAWLAKRGGWCRCLGCRGRDPKTRVSAPGPCWSCARDHSCKGRCQSSSCVSQRRSAKSAGARALRCAPHFDTQVQQCTLTHLPVHLVKHVDEKSLVELKGAFVLLCDLPNTIHKLQKDGRTLKAERDECVKRRESSSQVVMCVKKRTQRRCRCRHSPA